MTSSVVEDRDKLISEYEKLIDRLEKAEKWEVIITIVGNL